MLLRVESIKKAFGSQPILQGVTCDFPSGKISTVLGVSGSGKTTLLRIIAGLETADSGCIYLGEKDITSIKPHEKNFGMVFQDLGLYSHLSVQKNLSLTLLAHGISKSAACLRAKKIADQFGLGDFLFRSAGSLSGGEAQRLALARALVRNPKVMLLDEPFSNLDGPLLRDARRFTFESLASSATTTILVTHDHQDAQEAGGSVFFLEKGKIDQKGSWKELYQNPKNAQIARVVSFLNPLVLKGIISFSGDGPLLICDQLNITIPIDQSKATKKLKHRTHYNLFYRPENLEAKILMSEERPYHQVRGTVIGTFCNGAIWYCRVKHESGLIFEAKIHPEQSNSLGSEILVDFGTAPQTLIETCNP